MAQRTVMLGRVAVRFDELEDSTAHVMTIQPFKFLCEFDLQCVEERLCHCLVPAVSTAVHRAFGTMLLEPSTAGLRTVSTTSVTVNDHAPWAPTPQEGHLQRIAHQR